MDAEITDGSQVLSGLDPITEYLLEVFVSNGQEDEVMTFPVTTSAGKDGAVLRGRVGISGEGGEEVFRGWLVATISTQLHMH